MFARSWISAVRIGLINKNIFHIRYSSFVNGEDFVPWLLFITAQSRSHQRTVIKEKETQAKVLKELDWSWLTSLFMRQPVNSSGIRGLWKYPTGKGPNGCPNVFRAAKNMVELKQFCTEEWSNFTFTLQVTALWWLSSFVMCKAQHFHLVPTKMAHLLCERLVSWL